ncbi:hypothetical protein F5148DRAFT_1287096 [Russula earlei]|uniref:Uncharacterized protein n=1 Tax=Russula earlei TaxID=71964 RepID=A0ACC0U3H3_9AGAM|nr:hypothetical protein F5148DRAFT_1287096 [Russula earlei]
MRSITRNHRNEIFDAGKQLLPFVFFLLAGISFVHGQAPGGVSGSITTWFKANTTVAGNLTIPSTATNKVSQWTSEVGSFSMSQSVTGQQPVYTAATTSTGNFNFNPFIQFSKSGGTVLYNANTTPDLLGDNGTIFIVVNTYNTVADGNPSGLTYKSTSYGYQYKPAFRIQTGNGVSGSTGDYYNWAPYPSGVPTYPATSGIILDSRGVDKSASDVFFKAKRNGDSISLTHRFDLPYDGYSYSPSVNYGLFFGSDGTGTAGQNMSCGLAEVITYNGYLSDADENKVATYLAVKYGITLTKLQSTTNQDYVSSGNTIIWNSAANASYKFNITGIGRDDASGLLQKQSKSAHNNALISLYNGNTGGVFPATNVANASAVSADQSFLLAGDNGLANTLTGCAFGGRAERMARIWKAQKTGSGISQATIAVNTTDVAATVKNIIVSQDPTFPASASTFYKLSTGSGQLYATIPLNNNDYFTFAADSLQVTLTPVMPACSDPNSGSITSVVTGGVAPYAYTWNVTPIQGNPALVNVPAGTYALTVKQANGICAYTVQATITPAVVPGTPTASPVTICSGSTAALTVQNPQSGITYNWYTAATGEAVSAGGCISNPRIAVSVTLYRLLAQPVVTASNIAVTSVTFTWLPVTGAVGYLLPGWPLPAQNGYCQTLSDAVYIPNAFSPNGDGNNETFKVYSNAGVITGMDMKIFNQWGQLIYENNNPAQGWDGSYKGKQQPMGVYMYVVKIQLGAGSEVIRKGSVNLTYEMTTALDCNNKRTRWYRTTYMTLVVCALLIIKAGAQTPGGVSGNITAWFKANTSNAANLVLNGTTVSQWNSEVNTYSTAQAAASRQPQFINASNANTNFNFNPSLQFDRTTLRSLNNTSATPDLLGTNGTLFLVLNTYNYSASSSSCFAYMSNSSYRYQVKAHFRIQTGNNSTGYTADFNPQFPSDYGDIAGRIEVSRSTGSDFYSKRNGDIFSINNTDPLYNPAISTGLCIGSNNNGGGSEYSNSAIAEVITYSVTLADADINKVESYLAIKYGITLSQSATYNNNYTSSNGTIVWNGAANNAYAINITGIGRDDVSGLLQKQSRSVNTNGLVSVYNSNNAGVFPDMNAGNTTTFSADQSFLLFGDNGASTTFSSCAFNGKMPRMSRIWKAQKTGTIDTVTLAVNTADVSAQVKNILVSPDPSFPAGTTTVYPLQSGSSRLYKAIALHNNDYFTFATDSLQVSFSNVQPTCNNTNGGSITATVTGGATPQLYSWNSSPTQSGLTASNLAAGYYTFTVTNSGGCAAVYQDSLQTPIHIILAPTASPDTICAGVPASLAANASGASASAVYTWSPGNITGQNTSVSPVTTTKYTITIQDGACTIQDSVTITVKPIPTVTFTINPSPVCVGHTDTITYTGSAAGTATYNWNFNGGAVQSGSGQGPYVITYNTPGTKSIQLQVVDNGCAASGIQPVNVSASPAVSFTATPSAICQGQTVNVNFTGTTNTGASYAWNWGNGIVQAGTGQGPYTVQYNTTDSIRLTVTQGACVVTAPTQNIMVTPMPVASFTADTIIGCNPFTVTFTNTSQNATGYTWDFTDGNTSTAATPPAHVFAPGVFNVTLTATAGQCSNTSAVKQITVLPKPVASFSAIPGTNTPTQLSFANFSFSNTSQNATHYVWLFGDNDTSFLTSPTHQYNLPGQYTVTLYAINDIGCIDSVSKEPYIVIPDSTLAIPNAFSPNGDGTGV